MKTNLRNMMKATNAFGFSRWASALLLAAALIWTAVSPVRTVAAACAPTQDVDLWAKPGTATLYGTTSVNIWGYSSSAAGAASLPGPVIDLPQGTCVRVNLHNTLTENTALNFQGQSLIPDETGAAPGSSISYVFSADNPGTYLYEAGLIRGGQHQVAMGLYGALIVRPATPGQAYNAANAYDTETALVLSEIDTTLNTVLPAAANVNPAAFDMRKYAPKFYLINGKAYAGGSAADINVAAGNIVLLRYVNAGLQSHSMSLLGLGQSVIALDGSLLGHPHSLVAETIAPGQTLDALTTIPVSTPDGTRYPLYDASLPLRNTNTAGLGGMITFLAVGAVTPPTPVADTLGPAVSGLSLAPSPTDGLLAVTISATVSDLASGGNAVNAAQFYIDSTLGTPAAMTGTFGTPTVTVSGSISSAALAGLSSGNHSIFVRGQDALGNWGSFLAVTLTLDKSGPVTTLALSPNPSDGSLAVTLNVTANDTTTGGSTVSAAEYWVDGAATHTAMTASGAAATIRGYSAMIAAGLSQGTHVVSARSQDAFGNWGAVASTNLIVSDTHSPTASGVSASPNPNNGTKPFNSSIPAVRVTAAFSDVSTGNSNIVAAEGFIDTVRTNGTGFAFIANDGLFNAPAESGYADVPLAVVATLSNGNHTIYVHAKDAAGNWGSMATTILTIDMVPPTVVSINRANGSPTNAASVAFTVIFSDPVSGVSSSNFNLVNSGLTAPAISAVVGSGTVWTVTATTGNATNSGTLGLNLTATAGIVDLANNTLAANGAPMTGQVYTVDKAKPTYTSLTLAPTSIIQGSASILMTVNGSADAGGSGLASAGDYWFDSLTAPVVTNGFSGTSGITVATATLTAGSHVLSARIRDNAGNLSTIHTATLTVQADAIFADSFEGGTSLPGAWSSVSTATTSRVNITTTAALVGTNGLQAQGNNTNYVQSNFGTVANPASATYDARFYFNPNNNASTGSDIFAAAAGSGGFGTSLFHVRYRRNLGVPQVQIQVGTTANLTWVNIVNASNYIEVVWQSGGTLKLYVNGVLSQTLTASAGSIGAVRLGSVTSGGSNILMYFDNFASKRSVLALLGL